MPPKSINVLHAHLKKGFFIIFILSVSCVGLFPSHIAHTSASNSLGKAKWIPYKRIQGYDDFPLYGVTHPSIRNTSADIFAFIKAEFCYLVSVASLNDHSRYPYAVINRPCAIPIAISSNVKFAWGPSEHITVLSLNMRRILCSGISDSNQSTSSSIHHLVVCIWSRHSKIILKT
jgi:hypothetical protein